MVKVKGHKGVDDADTVGKGALVTKVHGHGGQLSVFNVIVMVVMMVMVSGHKHWHCHKSYSY